MKTRRLCLYAATTLLAVACQDHRHPISPPSFEIQDAFHGTNRNPHFFWLPPMEPQPTFAGTFNATLSPVVEITESVGSQGCGTLPAIRFTTLTGPGGEKVGLDVAGQKYTVNWHTKDFALREFCTYRISVLVSGLSLGFADVDVVLSGADLKKVDTDQYIPLLDDRTLPIKFRIEDGAVAFAAGDPNACSPGHDCGEAVIQGGANAPPATILTEARQAGVFLPTAALATVPSTIIVLIEQITHPSGPCIPLNRLALPQFDNCYKYEAFAPGGEGGAFQVTQFGDGQQSTRGDNLTVGMCVEVGNLTDAQRKQLEVFRVPAEGPVEALADAPAAFLPCDPAFGTVPAGGGLASFVRHTWRRLFASVGAAFGPRPLYASVSMTHLGLGGSTCCLSSFTWGRPAAMSPNGSSSFTAPGDGTIVPGPSVSLMDVVEDGVTLPPGPVAGVTVTFSVSSGNGYLNGNPATQTVLTTTDANGLAGLASWTVPAGPGPFTLTASAPGAIPNTVTFTATGSAPIRVSGFTSPRDPNPLVDPSGNASSGLSGSSNIVSALKNAANFGANGTVKCGVEIAPFVSAVASGSLVDGQGHRSVDVFFAGLTTTALNPAEATELAAFVQAGGIIYLAGDTDEGDGTSYNALFGELDVSDGYSVDILTSAASSGQSSTPAATPVTSGPFGVVGPLEHTGFRILTTSAMTAVASGNATTSALVAEGKFGSGRIAAMGDPLYWNQFTGVDADNQRYFLNLFALACPAL